MRVTDELMETPGVIPGSFSTALVQLSHISLPRGALYESRGMSHQAFLFRHVECFTAHLLQGKH